MYEPQPMPCLNLNGLQPLAEHALNIIWPDWYLSFGTWFIKNALFEMKDKIMK